VQRIYTVLQISSGYNVVCVPVGYSAMNNIWLILVKYAIELGDCTMLKQQT